MAKKENLHKGDLIMRKTLSLILAVLMIVATMPIAFAAESLKETNVSKWPTVTSPSEDGYFYFGQKIGDITVNDDEVVLDSAGNQVAGHFEITSKATTKLAVGENKKLSIKFIPDSSEYSGFTKLSSPVTYTCKMATPVFIDEANDPVVATEAEIGRALSVSTLSGGAMCNPWDSTADLSSYSWEWKEPDVIVENDGFYTAIFKAYYKSYNPVEKEVYVTVKAAEKIDTEFNQISSPIYAYNTVTTWGDVIITGSVVERGTANVVDGTFAITNKTLTSILRVGTYDDVTVTFTPNDSEKYIGCETTTTVTVTKGTPALKDGVVPTVTGSYGELTYMSNIIPRYTTAADSEFTVVPCNEAGESLVGTILPIGTHSLKAKLTPKKTNTNWEEATLDFIYVVTPIDATFERVEYNYKTGALKGYVNSRELNGTADIFIGDELVAEGLDLPFAINWTPADTSKDGVYNLKLVYNAPAGEAENAVITEPYETQILFKAKRAITVKHEQIILKVNNSSYNPNNTFAGDTIHLDTMSGFLYWEITDVNGNSVLDKLEVTVNTTESKYFQFKMPEYDIIINAVHDFDLLPPEEEKPDDGENGGGILDGITDIDGIDGFFEWIANLFAKIKAFFEKIIAFFQGIGDMT